MVVQDTAVSPAGTPDPAVEFELSSAAHLPYWRDRLRGATPPRLPAERVRSTGGRSTARHAFDLPADVATRLLELVARCGVAPLDVTLAAVQIILSRYADTPDVTVATVADGGAAHPVAVRSEVTGSATFAD